MLSFTIGRPARFPNRAGRLICHSSPRRNHTACTVIIKCNPDIGRNTEFSRRAEVSQAQVLDALRSVKDPVGAMQSNALGTLNALIAASDLKVKRFIYCGSAAAYGESPALPKVETMTSNPLSPYAVSSIAAENQCRVFFNTYGLQTVILRPFNVYGPAQDPTGNYAAVVPRFVVSLLQGRPPLIAGDGKQSRDFVGVSDVLEAIKAACVAPKAEGEIFNIATGSRITINGLVNIINSILGKEIQPKYEEARPGDIRHSLADTTKAEEMLGYRARVSITDGLRKTIEWYRKDR